MSKGTRRSIVALVLCMVLLGGCANGAPAGSSEAPGSPAASAGLDTKVAFFKEKAGAISGTVLEKLFGIGIDDGTVFALKDVPWKTAPEQTMKNQGWSAEHELTKDKLPFDPAERGMQVTEVLTVGEGLPEVRIRNGYEDGKLVSMVYDLFFETEEEMTAWYAAYVEYFEEKLDMKGEIGNNAGMKTTYFTLPDPAQSQITLYEVGTANHSFTYEMFSDDPQKYQVEIQLQWAMGAWAVEHLND